MAYAIRKASSLSAPGPERALGAIWRMYNLLVTALDGHLHGGVTAGGAASSGWQVPATAFKLGNHDRKHQGAAVAAIGASGVQTFTPRSRDGHLVSELIVALNQLTDTLNAHTHNATAGGANTAAWAAPATIRKVGDGDGRDPDGVLVTASANGQAPLRLRIAGYGSSSEAGALVKAWNGLVQAIDGHVHGGVTAGGANTTALALSGANAAKVADLYGRDVDGAVVA